MLICLKKLNKKLPVFPTRGKSRKDTNNYLISNTFYYQQTLGVSLAQIDAVKYNSEIFAKKVKKNLQVQKIVVPLQSQFKDAVVVKW